MRRGPAHLRDLPASQILATLADSREDRVSVREFVGAMGLRTHGIILILFALPDAVPLPLPSLSLVLGVPLVIVAAHLVVFGEGSGLPERVLSASIRTSALRVLSRLGGPVLRALEYLTRPRLPAVLTWERSIGLVCLYLSVLLLAPLPFVNFAPGVCLVGLALGMVQRDGLLVLVSAGATAVMTVVLVVAADWLLQYFAA
jgi:hypothetical protein